MSTRVVGFAVLLAATLATVSQGWATSIDYRPALIPIGGSPLPVPLAIEPRMPTTRDIIRFTAPLDDMIYSNRCVAANELGGSPVLNIDEESRTIDITFDGVFNPICTREYDPVVGAFGDLGNLPAGDWVLNNTDAISFFFTVSPAPLEGDYNSDGSVDLSDYTVWRNNLGASGLDAWAPGDGNGDGDVTAADYAVWKDQFGMSLIDMPASNSNSTNVPEPAGAVLLSVGLLSALRLTRLAEPRRHEGLNRR